MSAAREIPSLPAADPATISDQLLETLIGIAEDARTGATTEDKAALLLICAQPCLEELLDSRRRAAAGLELVPDITPSNVVPLLGPGDRP